jgi:hypothetical protein
MKRPVYQQIAMELKDLRYQQGLDRAHGISADFSITRDLARNIDILVDMHLPPGTEFEFSSFANRMYFRGETHTCTVEASLSPGVDISVKAHKPPHMNDPCDEEVLYQFTKSLMKEVEIPC